MSVRKTVLLLLAMVALYAFAGWLIVQDAGARTWSWTSSYASVFDQAAEPQLACRSLPGFGVAHKTLPCGTKLRICYRNRRCQNARVEDRGPYVAGRVFDLDVYLADALVFPGLGRVTWHRGWVTPR